MHLKGPKSLYFRFLLITIIPVIAVQMITTYIFYERHWDSLSRNMIGSLSGEVTMIVHGIANTPEEQRAQFINTITSYIGISVTVDRNQTIIPTGNINARYPELLSSLKTKISADMSLFPQDEGRLRLEVQQGTDVIRIIFNDKRIVNPSTYIFILWVIGSAILLLAISLSFLRIQVRSILNLTKAAEGFGKGGDLKDFKPAGATEIRRAGIAFIEMKERIKRLMDTRTQMLAGVSHDLKTPLTRMKLILSMLADRQNKEQIEAEVDEMNKMIEGYLSFAQLDSPDQFVEPISELNLKNFIESLVSRYQNFPNKISVEIPGNIFIHIRPEYFRRSLSNIIDNSIKYAKTLKISAKIDEKNAYIIFEDDGPGIPESKFEEVFQPFYRIDASRNSETGGVGLGLSITRDIINKHGGDIKLSKSKLGGLCTTIILPK
jgi:two-component system, OmpR family, osmolarity sensor histidine kinase EnvZ